MSRSPDSVLPHLRVATSPDISSRPGPPLERSPATNASSLRGAMTVNRENAPEAPPSPRSVRGSVRSLVMSTISDLERGTRGARSRAGSASNVEVESEMVSVGSRATVVREGAFLAVSKESSTDTEEPIFDRRNSRRGLVIPKPTRQLGISATDEPDPFADDERTPLITSSTSRTEALEVAPRGERLRNTFETPSPLQTYTSARIKPPLAPSRSPSTSELDFLADLLHTLETTKHRYQLTTANSPEPQTYMDEESDSEVHDLLSVSRARVVNRLFTVDYSVKDGSTAALTTPSPEDPIKVTRRRPKRRRTATADSVDRASLAIADVIRARISHLHLSRSARVADFIIPRPRSPLDGEGDPESDAADSLGDAEDGSGHTRHNPSHGPGQQSSTWSRWWRKVVLPRLPAIMLAVCLDILVGKLMTIFQVGVRSSWLVAGFVPVVVSAAGGLVCDRGNVTQ
ncbi:hypothetical protein HDU93_005019 [Gonapodya sp. JEL0774]|nr:hypothetical protein HDU93_005019 [Gonapodya sp. JEL0774]